MTRKAFIADVVAESNSTVSNIDYVQIGVEGEDFVFNFITGSGDPVLIRALATDAAAYPKGNTYFLGIDSISAPPAFENALEDIQGSLAGLTIHDLLVKVATILRSVSTGSKADPLATNNEDVNMNDDVVNEHSNSHTYGDQVHGENEDDEDDNWPPDSPYSDIFLPSISVTMDPSASKSLNRRIRQDIRRVKMAGFRVGILAGMNAESKSSILSISIKVAHLGLSEQAIEAWDLERHQYIVLLIQYAGQYVTFQKLMDTGVRQLQTEFRLGVCNRYKPSLLEAVAAFSNSQLQTDNMNIHNLDENPEGNADAKFQTFFISSPMNQLINDRFLSLLKIRKNDGVGWEAAKHIYNQHQSRAGMSSQKPFNNIICEALTNEEVSPLATADNLEGSEDEDYSLPLIAMQFALRYLVRCTEFCLVCHKKTEESFEALKPYVCSDPLCLYQYMSLGFGPSIEHSVATQPYVVDLLISFAYASAHTRSLHVYPTGMGLVVPLPVLDALVAPAVAEPSISPPIDYTNDGSKVQVIHDVDFSFALREVTMDTADFCDAMPGDWVEITTQDERREVFHFRITSYQHPHMKLINTGLEDGSTGTNWAYTSSRGEEDNRGLTLNQNSISTSSSRDRIRVKLSVFSTKFDTLNSAQKDATIVSLLRNMPSINEMTAYLQTKRASGESSFRNWVDRLCPAALLLLRWIVASNRSCIIQVDRYPGQLEADVLSNTSRLNQRVTNVEGWVQFRFAQGAPDKEQRFHQALSNNRDSISDEYPTLFAWHGSSIQNWHSIIRTGLDFKKISNGRSFGNGCYHSQSFHISLSYCSNARYLPSCDVGPSYWPGSNLKIVQAICLNEIVNAPQEFTSHQPHLVVQHVDWIQCRYLFVQCGNGSGGLSQSNGMNQPANSATVQYIKQDPARQVRGNNGNVLGIPKSGFPSSRTFAAKNSKLGTRKKKQKIQSPTRLPSSNEIDYLTDDSDPEDINFLIDDDESYSIVQAGPKACELLEDVAALTDFIPGSLDRATINLLGPPSYATSAATSTLSRDLQALLKVQFTTPLHELGWYIDGETVSNIYQWIVELHSFDLDLPLAIEMKDANISSVVLEMRFGKNYPMSPPFVRVIRPRFMAFMAGGGGHVTAGGAMCMELLTNSGWSAASSIESVLLQVRMAISSTDPKPARLERRGSGKQQDYGIGEAIDAYLRACRAHGWEASDMGDFR